MTAYTGLKIHLPRWRLAYIWHCKELIALEINESIVDFPYPKSTSHAGLAMIIPRLYTPRIWPVPAPIER